MLNIKNNQISFHVTNCRASIRFVPPKTTTMGRHNYWEKGEDKYALDGFLLQSFFLSFCTVSMSVVDIKIPSVCLSRIKRTSPSSDWNSRRGIISHYTNIYINCAMSWIRFIHRVEYSMGMVGGCWREREIEKVRESSFSSFAW